MTINYEAYRVFYHVALSGSFTAAARILHNSQPNISRIIHQLEQELGCSLFARSNKGIVLTREGEILYGHVREAVRHIVRAETEIQRRASMETGQITIAASEAALRGVLLPVLKEYRQDHPGIQVNLHSMTTERAIDSLKQQAADIAVVTRPLHTDPTLTIEELAVFPDILIVPQDFLLPGQAALSLPEIADWPFVSMHRKSVSYEMLRDYFSGHGVLFQPGTFVSAMSQIPPMVASGLGAAFLPAFMVQDQLKNGEIKEVPLMDHPPSHTVCAITHMNQPLDAACLELLVKLRGNN